MHVEFPNKPPGCICGPNWSVVPPPPCPYHSFQVGTVPADNPMVPFSPHMTPKELAGLYRRLADALDPPVSTTTVSTLVTAAQEFITATNAFMGDPCTGESRYATALTKLTRIINTTINPSPTT